MKLFHLSDFHLGKRVHEFSLMEDQAYILQQILQRVEEETPDGVILAGDLYDRTVPSTQAIGLLDDFLCRLAQRQIPVFAISGNHDSPERLAFGGRLMAYSGIHFSPVYNGTVTPIPLQDPFGPVYIYLLPFVKPVHIRQIFSEEPINSYTNALRIAIDAMQINPGVRNVLVTHQFVTGAVRCDSEEPSVGGSDAVDVSVFDPFDYVALGHLHGPQQAGRPSVRYCGSPLKYSFSEARHQKSITVVELKEKGNVSIRTLPLTPKRDMTDLRGTYDELVYRGFYQNTTYQKDYVQITLTDEEDIPDARDRLRIIYPYLMHIRYDNTRTRAEPLAGLEDTERKSPLELLEAFYLEQNGRPMSLQQRHYTQTLMERIWEEAL